MMFIGDKFNLQSVKIKTRILTVGGYLITSHKKNGAFPD